MYLVKILALWIVCSNQRFYHNCRWFFVYNNVARKKVCMQWTLEIMQNYSELLQKLIIQSKHFIWKKNPPQQRCKYQHTYMVKHRNIQLRTCVCRSWNPFQTPLKIQSHQQCLADMAVKSKSQNGKRITTTQQLQRKGHTTLTRRKSFQLKNVR